MTSKMVERCARILEPQAWAALGAGDTLAYQNRRTSSLRKARKFIEAMREPTPEMVEAGANRGHRDDPRSDVENCWLAMIDSALREEAGRG